MCPVPGCTGHQDGSLTDWLSQHQLGDLAIATILRLLEQPPAIINLDREFTPEMAEQLKARRKAARESGESKLPAVLGDAQPGSVWLVRDLGTAEPRVAEIYPSEQQAREFAGRLEHANRQLVIERWDVPGHD